MQMGTTIAALSTPVGKGGIAVIRISGEDAISIAEKVFHPKNGMPLSTQSSNFMGYGTILHQTTVIDDGMAVVFRAPHSYTGEDTVEISCHGGILLSQMVLEALFLKGAIPAEAGEFTKRAFLAGKLSLSQAEAIIELIDAQSTEKVRMAGAQARGALKRKIQGIYDELKTVVSSVYAYIDFPDEDLTDFTITELKATLATILEKIESLLQTYHTGKAISEGVPTVIAGKPNTGKSSLLNLLLGEDRAIVTEIAGTTRDILEETAVVGKVLLRLSDTAGIRSTDDFIETIGVKRAIEKLQHADLLLAVFDGSQPLDEKDFAFLEILRSLSLSCPQIAVVNKLDLPSVLDKTMLQSTFPQVVEISADTGAGIQELTAHIEQLFIDGSIQYDQNGVISNARQYASLKLAAECMHHAQDALNAAFSQDIAGLDLELALSHLGELDGRKVTEEIVDTIFHRFCVGK